MEGRHHSPDLRKKMLQAGGSHAMSVAFDSVVVCADSAVISCELIRLRAPSWHHARRHGTDQQRDC